MYCANVTNAIVMYKIRDSNNAIKHFWITAMIAHWNLLWRTAFKTPRYIPIKYFSYTSQCLRGQCQLKLEALFFNRVRISVPGAFGFCLISKHCMSQRYSQNIIMYIPCFITLSYITIWVLSRSVQTMRSHLIRLLDNETVSVTVSHVHGDLNIEREQSIPCILVVL